MAEWVLAAERAYVAAAVGAQAAQPDLAGAADADDELAGAARRSVAVAAAGAVASRHLAVATPRSLGIVIDDARDADAGALTLVAHRTWFAPRDIRCASTGSGAADLAAATGGRVVSVDEALACDIVNVLASQLRITPALVRRGTHLNLASAGVLDPDVPAVATVVREADLPALAAGLIEGRQLDEITVFIADGAPIAGAAIDIRAVP